MRTDKSAIGNGCATILVLVISLLTSAQAQVVRAPTTTGGTLDGADQRVREEALRLADERADRAARGDSAVQPLITRPVERSQLQPGQGANGGDPRINRLAISPVEDSSDPQSAASAKVNAITRARNGATNAQQADELRRERDDLRQARIKQARALLVGWRGPALTYTAPKSDVQAPVSDNASEPVPPNTPAISNLVASDIAIPAGSIYLARLDIGIDTDALAPAGAYRATLLSGPAKGQWLLGTATANAESITLVFNTLSDGRNKQTRAINAIALDLEYAPTIGSEVDRHYLSRFAAAVATGVPAALDRVVELALSNGTTVSVNGDTVATTTAVDEGTELRAAVAAGLQRGTAALGVEQSLAQMARRPATVKEPMGAVLAVQFLEGVAL